MGVEVSNSDKYFRKREPAFDKFKGALIQAEKRYMGSKSKYDFLHMLFVLAAQLEAAHGPLKIAKYGAEALNVILYANDPIGMWRGKTTFYARTKDLIELIRHWWTVLDSRYSGGIEWAQTKEEQARDLRELDEEEAEQAKVDGMAKRKHTPMPAKERAKAVKAIMDRSPAYGSVPYLATVSHSVSRNELYPPVDTFLRAQFDSHVTPPKR